MPVSIDLRKVFHEKNPKLAPYIPGFVYRYLNHALHIREINTFMAENGTKTGLDFTEAVIKDFNVTFTLKGEENLPTEGRFIFVSNHPLGGFDGMILLTILGKRYHVVKSLSNDILMTIANLKTLFVPVNKHGAMTRESALLLEEVMKSDIHLLTFPSGFVSRRKRGIIRDFKWQKSFITQAVKYKRDVIPIHVTGRCTNFFYNLSNIRTFLGIKANLEMFYLPDETYRHRNEHLTITFGKPVPYTFFDKRKRHEEWAYLMQNYVYTLGEGYPDPFTAYISNNP